MEGGRRPNFSALLEQSRQLTHKLDTGDYFIKRNVEQIDETSRKLLAASARSAKDVAKNKGRYLLATKGFDAEKLARNLHAINLKTTFEPLEPLSETDLEGYLKYPTPPPIKSCDILFTSLLNRHEHDTVILTAIQEAKKEVSNYFNI